MNDLKQKERESIQLALIVMFGVDKAEKLVKQLKPDIDYANAAQAISEARAYQFLRECNLEKG